METEPLRRPPAWVQDAVFYQIFPDRFAASTRVRKPAGLEPWDDLPTTHGYKGGDLLGIVERLDWITDLGATALYLNPIFQSASNHRYHTHDYFKVDPLLGGDAAFAELLQACRQRSIRVVIDGVFNHASRGFFQFHDLLENGPQSPWTDWFVVHDWPLKAYAPDGEPNYAAWWGMPALPKFNTDNPAVADYLIGVGEHWARAGIDGWRLDVPQEITTPGFWEAFRERVRAINPDLYLVGEIWDDATDWIADGTRFDGAMNYLFTAATQSFTGGRHLDLEAAAGLTYQLDPMMDAVGYGARIGSLLASYPGHAAAANLNLLDSHDTPRFITVAQGSRDIAVLGALLLFTFPGAPSIYYGDEIGLPGRHDPDNRRGFPWNGDHDSTLLDAYRSLVALRHAEPGLRSLDYRQVWPPPGEHGTMLYAFTRGDLLVAVNAGDDAEVAPIPTPDLPAADLAPVWGRGQVTMGEHVSRVSLGPRSGAVWRVVPVSA